MLCGGVIFQVHRRFSVAMECLVQSSLGRYVVMKGVSGGVFLMCV